MNLKSLKFKPEELGIIIPFIHEYAIYYTHSFLFTKNRRSVYSL